MQRKQIDTRREEADLCAVERGHSQLDATALVSAINEKEQARLNSIVNQEKKRLSSRSAEQQPVEPGMSIAEPMSSNPIIFVLDLTRWQRLERSMLRKRVRARRAWHQRQLNKHIFGRKTLTSGKGTGEREWKGLALALRLGWSTI
jgi:hypothetical protein